jgi:hypothetical protein
MYVDLDLWTRRVSKQVAQLAFQSRYFHMIVIVIGPTHLRLDRTHEPNMSFSPYIHGP